MNSGVSAPKFYETAALLNIGREPVRRPGYGAAVHGKTLRRAVFVFEKVARCFTVGRSGRSIGSVRAYALTTLFFDVRCPIGYGSSVLVVLLRRRVASNVRALSLGRSGSLVGGCLGFEGTRARR